MHLTWANTAAAHNTLTVDEISQAPQGDSRRTWAGARGNQRVFVTVLEPHRGAATVRGIEASEAGSGPSVTLTHQGGRDVLVMPAAYDGVHVFQRLDAGGQDVAREATRQPPDRGGCSGRIAS